MVGTKEIPKNLSSMRWLRFVQEARIPIGSSFRDYEVAVRKPPFCAEQLPEYENLLRQGRQIAAAVCEGTALGMRHAYFEPTTTVVVGEAAVRLRILHASSKLALPAHLQRRTSWPVVAYNPEQKAGFIGHAFEQVNAADAIERAVDLLDAKTIVLFGGRASSRRSFETVCIAEALLSKHGERIKIVGRDTLRQERPVAIGLDTHTGEIFVPSNDTEGNGVKGHHLRIGFY